MIRTAGGPSAPYRVGIIGFGRIGRRRAALVNAHPRLALAAVADPYIGDPAAASPSCTWHRSGADLLSQDLDAVFVCIRFAVATNLVVAALEAGKLVFAEKPPGRCVADIERMRDAEARFPHLRMKFGFNHREHDSVRLSQCLILIGRVRAVDVDAGDVRKSRRSRLYGLPNETIRARSRNSRRVELRFKVVYAARALPLVKLLRC